MRRPHRLRAALVACCAATACASGAVARAPLLAAAGGLDCTALGPVEGHGTGGERVTHEMQVYWATHEALNAARALGATHVVLDHERASATELTLSGFAYRCP